MSRPKKSFSSRQGRHKALPVPTALGWLLLDSLFDRKPTELLATFAAIGFATSRGNSEEERAFERYRKYLRLQAEVETPHSAPLAEFSASLLRGLRAEMRKTYADDLASGVRTYRHIRDIRGPFTALACKHTGPYGSADVEKKLLTFSERLDHLGVLFEQAADHDDLVVAKEVLLDNEDFCENYWSLPEGDMPDPGFNRACLIGANDWGQLHRACAPLVFLLA